MSLDGKHALPVGCVLPAPPPCTPGHLSDQQATTTNVLHMSLHTHFSNECRKLMHFILGLTKVTWPTVHGVQLRDRCANGSDAAELSVAHCGERN